MQRTRISDIFASDAPLGEALVQGWVKTRRSSRSVSFVQVNDGSTLRDLQVVVGEDSPAYAIANSLTTGCSVSVVGQVVESQGKGQRYEIQAHPSGSAGPRDLSAAERAAHAGISAEIAHRAPHQHLRSHGR